MRRRRCPLFLLLAVQLGLNFFEGAGGDRRHRLRRNPPVRVSMLPTSVTVTRIDDSGTIRYIDRRIQFALRQPAAGPKEKQSYEAHNP